MEKPIANFLTILLALVFIAHQAETRCNVCNSNGFACINETSFQLCFNGERNQMQSFVCAGDSICVDSRLRCTARGVASPDCPDSVNTCGQCDGINMFTCTSRSTFVQCNGTDPIPSVSGRCPDGLTCDVSNPEICVSACKSPENPQCTNDEPL